MWSLPRKHGGLHADSSKVVCTLPLHVFDFIPLVQVPVSAPWMGQPFRQTPASIRGQSSLYGPLQGSMLLCAFPRERIML